MTALKRSLCFASVLLFSHGALAETVGAGGQIQQIPPAPMRQNPVPQLPIPQQQPVLPLNSGVQFPVKALRITGQTHFSEAELIKITGFKPSDKVTLPILQAMAAQITNFYDQHGYFLARAYLPGQDITDGTVTIAVVEADYGQIGLHNTSKVSDVVLVRILNGLNRGDTVQSAPLERRLLLISDLPGVRVGSTLAPGAQVGTADLLVGVTPGPTVDGDFEADNAGNPYTGSYRLGGTINWNEPFGIGDVLSLRTLNSTDGDMNYLRVSYQAQLYDTTVGAALTGFRYRLGDQFQDLNANGWEGIGSLYASYPLIRSYNTNLNLLADVDQRFFQDSIGLYSISDDKRATVLIAGVAGDHYDNFGGGGWTNYAASGVVGDLTIETPAARTVDDMTARTNGGYAKLAASISRLQNLVGPLSLYVSFRGQVAEKNLDVSEKMELGGADGVRAYPEGEAYGDDGYIATFQPQLQLPAPAWLPGQLQLIGFVDTGTVKIENTPYSAGENTLTRNGIGTGLIWSSPNGFVVSLTYADLLGDNKATSYPDNSGEIWFQVIKYF